MTHFPIYLSSILCACAAAGNQIQDPATTDESLIVTSSHQSNRECRKASSILQQPTKILSSHPVTNRIENAVKHPVCLNQQRVQPRVSNTLAHARPSYERTIKPVFQKQAAFLPDIHVEQANWLKFGIKPFAAVYNVNPTEIENVVNVPS